MTSDWREVYLQEKRRLGYVIENGRLPRRDRDSGKAKDGRSPPAQEEGGLNLTRQNAHDRISRMIG